MRKKRSVVTKTYTTLLMCKPVDCGEIGIKLSNDASAKIQQKLNCQRISNRCCENVRATFIETGCQNNFTKTSLTSNENVQKMMDYIKAANGYIKATKNDTTDNIDFV